MSYYKQLKTMRSSVETKIKVSGEKGISEQELRYFVLKKFEVSERAFKKWLEELKEMYLIEEKGEKLIWIY